MYWGIEFTCSSASYRVLSRSRDKTMLANITQRNVVRSLKVLQKVHHVSLIINHAHLRKWVALWYGVIIVIFFNGNYWHVV